MIVKNNHREPRSAAGTKAILNGHSAEQKLVMLAFTVSLICHVALFSILIYAQTHRPKQRPTPEVMNVSLVSMPEYVAPSQPAKKATISSPAKKADEPTSLKKKTAVLKKKAPKAVKKKTSLKKKTFRSEKVKENTLKKLEKKVETSSSDRISKAIDQIKAKVGSQKPERPVQPSAPKKAVTGVPGGTGQVSGGKLAEIIDIYRVEIAYQVQRNWAFPDQLAGGRSDLQTLLVFKVMPNGEIKDLFFTDRSGNSHFDESAFRAVMKADPVNPHPKSVSQPYVQMGLRFTPEGIQ
jgi:colicin import membrane protein